jgi:hypothetical protein
MHRSRIPINRRNAADAGSGMRSAGSSRAKKLPFSRTNRLRTSQIAASMLVDSETVDIR